ncbi:primosomal protein N' family DNA-binding protein [Alloscardovia criceti]|uniref:primosomal protein N' family DNA-binding protein n=1 Tax=Alloscardovia criceti TaxID=356828 RepID=UPI000374DD8A|nr:hypothetical protein [Alloscardovia criceti]
MPDLHGGNAGDASTDANASAQAPLQPALEGLAPRKPAKKRTAATQTADPAHTPAHELPIARVVLDVQTPHLGQLFDYIVPEKLAEVAQPGMLIRARFGHKRCSGIIWQRVEKSASTRSSLKYLERVLGTYEQLSERMRADIEQIAHFFGGSAANIVRLAVPPRVARVEKEIDLARRSERSIDVLSPATQDFAAEEQQKLAALYRGIPEVARALSTFSQASHIVWDTLAGVGQWQRDIVWAVALARAKNRQVVVVLPDMRHVTHVSQALVQAGFREFAPHPQLGMWRGNFAVLNASLPAADRYRAFLAVSQGLVGCVIGTRAAMYAPVADNAVFISFHDAVYQNWDGFTPYPNVTDVLRIRAERSNAVVISAGYVRSRENQWQVENHPQSVIEVHGLNAVVSQRSAWIRHLNRQELERLADPAIGARVPSVAVRVMRKAAEKGPVLLSIPARSQAAVLCCSSCRKVAQCRRCLGPLMPGGQASNGRAICQWCGTVAAQWSCRYCGNASMRLLHIGTEGTAQELATLIPGVSIVISTVHQARGVVEEIPDRPALVIATPGAEPVIRDKNTGDLKGYQCVAIVDAWTSLYGSALDQRIDTGMQWSEAAALCVPASQGGQVLILGEADAVVASALTLNDGRVLTHREVLDAQETGLPPVVSAALVWGEKDSVDKVIAAVNEDFQGMPAIQSVMGPLPAILGPVPKAAPVTMRQYYMDGLYQRVQCVLRVDRAQLPQLVASLHKAQARHSAQRNAPELHFHINPKNLL